MADASTLLVEARARARLTQAELARRARTTQSAVSAYESGARTPSVPTLRRLLRAAGRDLATVPAAPSLRALVEANRVEITRIAARRGAHDIRVFGSVARGEEDVASDLDLLVDLDPDRDLLDLAALREDLQDLLGVSVDVATPQLLRDAVRPEVLSTARAL